MEFPEETSAAPKPITVKQLVYRLRDTVSIAMGTQWVVGELSNVKHHTSGHVYFTLMTSWSCPRSGYTVALPRTWTFIPSWSRMGHLEAAALKKAQKISAPCSFRVK